MHFFLFCEGHRPHLFTSLFSFAMDSISETVSFNADSLCFCSGLIISPSDAITWFIRSHLFVFSNFVYSLMSWISVGGSLSGIYRIADVTFQAPFLVSMDFHSLLRTLKLHCESDGIMSSIFTMEDSMLKNQSTGGRTIPANVVAFGKIWIWDINYSLLRVFPVRSSFCCHGFMLQCILEPDIFSRLFLSFLLKKDRKKVAPSKTRFSTTLWLTEKTTAHSPRLSEPVTVLRCVLGG